MQLGNLYILWTIDQRLTGQGLLACAARGLLGRTPSKLARRTVKLGHAGRLCPIRNHQLASCLIASWIGKVSKVNSSGYGGLHLLIR